MGFADLTEIKWQRLILAVVITFLIADTVPHPQLGQSLMKLGAAKLQQRWQPLMPPALSQQ